MRKATVSEEELDSLFPHLLQARHALSRDFKDLQRRTLQIERLRGASINMNDNGSAFSANVELEARLGKHTAEGFQTGVTATQFKNIEKFLKSSKHWYKTEDWSETCDVFFRTRVSMPDGSQEQQVSARSSIEAHDGSLHTKTILKQPLNSRFLQLQALNSCNQGTLRPSAQIDARVQASLEVDLPKHFHPVAVVPDYVRIKQRRSFYYLSEEINGTFLYQLTRVFADKSRSSAEAHLQRGKPTSYEVEIECLDVQQHLLAGTSVQVYLLNSMLAKLLDLAEIVNHQRTQTGLLTFKAIDDAARSPIDAS
jgi:hypothetical protein